MTVFYTGVQVCKRMKSENFIFVYYLTHFFFFKEFGSKIWQRKTNTWIEKEERLN